MTVSPAAAPRPTTPLARLPATVHFSSVGTVQNSSVVDNAFRDFLAGCSALGLALEWGSKGLSIRIQTPDRNLPLSIAWGLPDGVSWQGLKYLAVGVDRTSLAKMPSVTAAAERYISAIDAIPLGRVPNSAISARLFDASAAPAAVPAIIDAITALVEEVNETE